MIEMGKEYFTKELDKVTFLNLLETLDHVNVYFIDREKYKEKGENFVIKTGEDKHGRQYNLYLPRDLNSSEIPYLIYTLKNRFNLEFAENLVNQVISKSKLALYLLLENGENIDDLRKYTKNDKEFERKVKGSSLFSARENIKELREKHGVKSIKNVKLEKSDIDDFFDLDLEKLFLEKGKDLIRYSLYTITQAEQEEIDFSNEGYYKNVETTELDERERLLREAIGIDEWKRKLKQTREKGDKKEIEKLEFEASSTILKELYKYPYVNDENNNGYQPSKIVSSKELYCVGYSIVGHTFLSELGIKHKGVYSLSHVALEVDIGGKKYLFDVTRNNALQEIDYKDTGGIYKKMHFKNYSFNISDVITGNVEKILLVSVYHNKGSNLDDLGKYEEAIVMYDKVISVIPDFIGSYNNKGMSLYSLGQYEEAIIEFNKVIMLYDKEPLFYNNKGISLINLGKYEEAIVEFDKALELDDSNIKSLLYKGFSFHKLKLYKLAQQLFKDAYKKDSKTTKKFLIDNNLEKYMGKPEMTTEIVGDILKKFDGVTLNPLQLD